MPLYEYRCQSCGKTFEIIQKFSDAPLLIHEDCGGELEKLITAAAIKFKGTGWYVTDYAHGKSSTGNRSNGKHDGSGETKSAKSDAKSETKSETKTETKTESKPAATK